MGNVPQHFSQNFQQNFPQDFPARISHKIFPQEFPTRFSPQIFAVRISGKIFPARFSCKNFPQDYPTRISCKIFPSWILIGWLPITQFQMLNFHQSLPFLNWLFPLHPVLQDFLARISRKNFPIEFPTRFSHKIFPQ